MDFVSLDLDQLNMRLAEIQKIASKFNDVSDSMTRVELPQSDEFAFDTAMQTINNNIKSIANNFNNITMFFKLYIRDQEQIEMDLRKDWDSFSPMIPSNPRVQVSSTSPTVNRLESNTTTSVNGTYGGQPIRVDNTVDNLVNNNNSWTYANSKGNESTTSPANIRPIYRNPVIKPVDEIMSIIKIN